MTQIITVVINGSILMASDTRLNYHEEIEEDGQKYQLIKCIADCCRKTFYLKKANIGIQFLGIGYLKDGKNRYHLSHFLSKIEEGIKGKEGIRFKMKKVYSNLQNITTPSDTSNYVKGVMAGYYKKNPYIGTFNTFIKDNKLKIKKVKIGNFVDSEKYLQIIPKSEKETINEINRVISNVSKSKPHVVGNEIEILRITAHKFEYIQNGKKLFYGTQSELLKHFVNNLFLINGKILNKQVKEKINL